MGVARSEAYGRRQPEEVLVSQIGASGQTPPCDVGCAAAAVAPSTPTGMATTWSLVEDSNGPSEVWSHS